MPSEETPEFDAAKCARLIEEAARHIGLAMGEMAGYLHSRSKSLCGTSERRELNKLLDKAYRRIESLRPLYDRLTIPDPADEALALSSGIPGYRQVVIVGERLTSGNRSVRAAIERIDENEIADLARWQMQSGAHYLDVSAAALGVVDEPGYLVWLARIAEDSSRRPLSLDCQNPAALRAALEACRRPPIWNSLCPAAGNEGEILALLKEGLPCAGIVSVCQKEWGSYLSADERVELARRSAEALAAAGIQPPLWIFDPVTLPQSAGAEWEAVTLETISRLREEFPESSVLCAVSNHSFGLKERRPANRAWARQALAAGADIFLCDPLDGELMQLLISASRESPLLRRGGGDTGVGA